jgi:hypothetical protein
MPDFRFDWQPVGAAVFAVVFLGLVALVALGKLPAESVMAIVAWLIPSPMHRSEPKSLQSPPSTEVH